MLGRKANLLFAEKESSMQACNYAKGRNLRRNNANDSFGKGFHVLKDHMLNRLMTGRCPRTSLLAVTAEVPLAFSPK